MCKDRKVLRDKIVDRLSEYDSLGYRIVEKNKEVRHHIDLIPQGNNQKNEPMDIIISLTSDLIY